MSYKVWKNRESVGDSDHIAAVLAQVAGAPSAKKGPGTISVEDGETSVVGTDTRFTMLEVGDYIVANGDVVAIESIESDVALTIASSSAHGIGAEAAAMGRPRAIASFAIPATGKRSFYVPPGEAGSRLVLLALQSTVAVTTAPTVDGVAIVSLATPTALTAPTDTAYGAAWCSGILESGWHTFGTTAANVHSGVAVLLSSAWVAPSYWAVASVADATAFDFAVDGPLGEELTGFAIGAWRGIAPATATGQEVGASQGLGFTHKNSLVLLSAEEGDDMQPDYSTAACSVFGVAWLCESLASSVATGDYWVVKIAPGAHDYLRDFRPFLAPVAYGGVAGEDSGILLPGLTSNIREAAAAANGYTVTKIEGAYSGASGVDVTLDQAVTYDHGDIIAGALGGGESAAGSVCVTYGGTTILVQLPPMQGGVG